MAIIWTVVNYIASSLIVLFIAYIIADIIQKKRITQEELLSKVFMMAIAFLLLLRTN